MRIIDVKVALFAALEQDGRDFYARASQRVSDPEIARRFAEMAQGEMEHIRMLNFECCSITKRGAFMAHEDVVTVLAVFQAAPPVLRKNVSREEAPVEDPPSPRGEP